MSPLGQTISWCASARYRDCRRLLVVVLIVPLILALAAIWAFPVLAQTSPLFYRTDYPLDYGLEGGTSGLVAVRSQAPGAGRGPQTQSSSFEEFAFFVEFGEPGADPGAEGLGGAARHRSLSQARHQLIARLLAIWMCARSRAESFITRAC